jgi:hypothetical protein
MKGFREMWKFRLSRSRVAYAAAVAVLTACSGAGTQGERINNVGAIPDALIPNARGVLKQIPLAPDAVAPPAAKAHIYVSEYGGSNVLGYVTNNSKNKPPVCAFSGVGTGADDLGADAKGNLFYPSNGNAVIDIYGPDCGGLLGSINDPYGPPNDATSADALTGKIAVSNAIASSDKAGSLMMCTLKHGCTDYPSPSITGRTAGVAVDKNGNNCWVTSENASFNAATMTYYKGCKGSGVAATGFENESYGSLDIDAAGNLVSVDFQNSALYVYKGCDPKCRVVGGPFTLHGESFNAKVNDTGKILAAVEFAVGQVDIYSYTPRALTYKYSFNNGLSVSIQPIGVAFAPRSHE